MKKLYRADELAAQWRPRTRAEREQEEAQERLEFADACRRADAKGDRALELLHLRECNPHLNPSISRALAGDYEVRGSK